MLIEKDTKSLFSEDKNRFTSLHIACQNGDTQVARMLLDKGADVDHKNAQGDTPLNIAIRKHHEEIVKLLLSK